MNIVTNNSDAVIVETILAMADHMDLMTIAEGVETKEQMALLDSYGCQGYQGYLFSRPVSVSDYKKLLEEFSKDACGCPIWSGDIAQ
jgi:EAL domain-containing protein (putative c-di-GMP-specific phosphodiesterase class I)